MLLKTPAGPAEPPEGRGLSPDLEGKGGLALSSPKGPQPGPGMADLGLQCSESLSGSRTEQMVLAAPQQAVSDATDTDPG